jgi:hypothetical protein
MCRTHPPTSLRCVQKKSIAARADFKHLPTSQRLLRREALRPMLYQCAGETSEARYASSALILARKMRTLARSRLRRTHPPTSPLAVNGWSPTQLRLRRDVGMMPRHHAVARSC